MNTDKVYLGVRSPNWKSPIKHSANKTADKQSLPVDSSSEKLLVSRKSHQHCHRLQNLQRLKLPTYLLGLLWLCTALSQNQLKFLCCLNPLSYNQDPVKTPPIKAANTANTASTAWQSTPLLKAACTKVSSNVFTLTISTTSRFDLQTTYKSFYTGLSVTVNPINATLIKKIQIKAILSSLL